MSFPITIPGQANPLTFTLEAGETLVLLGANGTGKSALVAYLHKILGEHVIKISAIRQNCFETGKLSMSQSQRDNLHEAFKLMDREDTSRFFERNPSERANLPLFDLVSFENRRARKIATFIDSNDTERVNAAVNEACNTHSVIAQINTLFSYSNMPIEISIGDKEQLLASKNGCSHFDIAALSDGERNSVIVAATVLTTQPGTLILIDEPERHLHRSIIVPFVVELIKMRSDCSFLISTHEITLPSSLESPHILLVRECFYVNSKPASWDFDYIAKSSPENEELYEGLKKTY